MVRQKKILIIAGPNGAGKTTFATEFLPKEAECPNFINADLIAAGINPFRPDASSIQAAKMMLEMMKKYVEKDESFSFETLYKAIVDEWVLIDNAGKWPIFVDEGERHDWYTNE